MAKIRIKTIPITTVLLSNAENFCVSPDLKILAYVEDEILTLLPLNEEHALPVHLGKFNRYTWQEDYCSDGKYHLLTMTDTNSLIVHEVSTQNVKNSFMCIFSILYEIELPLMKGIPKLCQREQSNIEILAYTQQKTILFFEREIILSIELSSSQLPVYQSSLQVSEYGSSVSCFQLHEDMLFTLNQDGAIISLYSIQKGEKQFEWNLHSIFNNPSNWSAITKFSIASDFESVVICNSKNQVFRLQLNRNQRTEQKTQQKIITAFAKKMPSLTKVSERTRIVTSRFQKILFHQMELPSNFSEDIYIEDIFLMGNKTLLHYQNKSKSNFVLLCVDDCGSVFFQERFDERISAIKMSGTSHSFLFVSGNDICSFLINSCPEKLISELVIYFSGEAAEKLSSLNNWQDIDVKLEVLEHGLKNHQLDVISFFLRTQEEGFHHVWANETEEIPKWSTLINLQSQHWESITRMILDTIKDNIRDVAYCQFAEQLLQLIVGTLTRLINVISNEDQRESIKPLLDEHAIKFSIQFASYFQEARLLLHSQSAQSEKALGEKEYIQDEVTTYGDDSLQDSWIIWSQMHWQEAIKSAVKQNKALSIQAYLLSSESDVQIKKNNIWPTIISIGTTMAEEFLLSGNFKEAIEMFANMGFSPSNKLMDIFKTTSNSQLRNNSVMELKRQSLLSESDEKMMQLIEELENIYPCREIEQTNVLCRDGGLSSSCFSTSNLYCNLVFNWISKWNENVGYRVILGAHHDNTYSRLASLPSQIYWEYLLEYRKLIIILSWICAISSNKLSDKSVFPFGWTITDSMLKSIKPLSITHVQETVLDNLARLGIFCEEELEEFPLLIRRLGHINFNLTDMSVFDSADSNISVQDFIHRVIHYSLLNCLSNFLYFFLKERSYSIQPFPHCIYCSTPLLSVISAFSDWSKKYNDSDFAFQAMMASAQYVYNMPDASIQSLWKCSPINIIIAIILFAPMQLSKLNHNKCKKAIGVESQHIQSSLSQIPLLCDALFKESKENSTTKLHVSVYQLLQENALFDPTRLFGWQTTNNIINEDAIPELPHFSLPNLVEVFGYKRKLMFHYYLLNGRPNFAYVKFIIQELSSAGVITSRRINSACREAMIIAIRHYNEVKITASCAVFTEMLGQDSRSLRTHIQLASIISKNKGKLEDAVDQELAMLLESSFYNKIAAKETLTLLEHEVEKEIRKIRLKRNPGLEIMWWVPAIIFCHIHHLDPSVAYMQQCAKNSDWLRFLAFAQVYQIPLNQVLTLLGEFSNPYLVDHLFNAFRRKGPILSVTSKNKSSLQSPKVKAKQRSSEFRKTLYVRIGVASQEPLVNTVSAPELSSDDDASSSLGSEETITDGDAVTLCKDLWGQILICHTTVCPWRSLLQASCSHNNPVLAVIAASYQGASIQCCLAIWLHTSMSRSSSSWENIELKDIPDIADIMKDAVKSRKFLLLQKGFMLFRPNSPLLYLINFLTTFLFHKQYESSVEHLKQFQRHLWNYASSNDDETLPFADINWLEKTCIMLLIASISSCETLHEKKILLRHYFFAKIQSTFTSIEKVPDFNKLYHLVQSIGDLDVKVYIEDLLQSEQSDKYKEACTTIIQKLQQTECNDEAYVFAKIAKLPLDEILLCQIVNEMQKYRSHSDWDDLKVRIQFWEQCTNTLHIGNVKPILAAQFFKNESDKTTSYIEKFILTKLAIRWMLEVEPTSEETTKLIGEWEVNMWLYCVKAEVEIKRMEEEDIFSFDVEKCCDDLLDFLEQEIQNPSFIPLKLNSDEELFALNRIIGKLLNLGNVKEAQKINQIFSHKSIDVHIVVTCIKLAKQIILPKDIDPELRKLISDKTMEKSIRTEVSFISLRTSEDIQQACLNSEQREIANVIKQFGQKSTAAFLACKRIFIYYICSQILGLTYDDVRTREESFKLLKAILISTYPDKYIVAKDLLALNSATDDEVIEFLSQEIMTCLQVFSGTAEFSMAQSSKELIFNPSNMGDTFQQLLYLCEDPSLLGMKLLNIVDREIEKKPEIWIKSNLCLIVELYIRSHDCFTAACNMEGISRILHHARKMARMLTDAEEYHLLVRLLTGIGRYSEMTYIFDILREKHQFELLFRKGMEKVPHLRIALLDYLKHCCTVDSYVYPMLALNFSMFREIAEMLEISANESLKKMRKKDPITTNINLKDELLTVIQEFADAAESYSKADCISHANRCVQQAKLVALQIYLLPKNIWVIGLDNQRVIKIIAEHPKFSESYIIAEAYQHHDSWDRALYQHVIQKGDWSYFAEFQTSIGLSSVLMQNISRRLLVYSPKCENEIQNLKRLLQKCDTEIKYKIATEFGFKDIINDLLKGDCGAYIKDIICKVHKKRTNT